MCNYKLTVTLEKSVDVVDGGGWVIGMTWRKGRHPRSRRTRKRPRPARPAQPIKPAMDDLGYMLWDRCYGMCNRQCWQWELVSAHSTCVNEILRKAGIDWPVDGIPASTSPSSPSTSPSTDLRKGERWTPNESWNECADCWR